jgi:hypothetical protein
VEVEDGEDTSDVSPEEEGRVPAGCEIENAAQSSAALVEGRSRGRVPHRSPASIPSHPRLPGGEIAML